MARQETVDDRFRTLLGGKPLPRDVDLPNQSGRTDLEQYQVKPPGKKRFRELMKTSEGEPMEITEKAVTVRRKASRPVTQSRSLSGGKR